MNTARNILWPKTKFLHKNIRNKVLKTESTCKYYSFLGRTNGLETPICRQLLSRKGFLEICKEIQKGNQGYNKQQITNTILSQKHISFQQKKCLQ